MPDFCKVSIKMAKVQGLSLNPGKISGLCGRLMCCLSYENEHYSEAYKKMPKLGGEVSTPEGRGTVVSNNMLKYTVRVKLEKDGTVTYKDFPLAEIRFRGKGAPAEEPSRGGKSRRRRNRQRRRPPPIAGGAASAGRAAPVRARRGTVPVLPAAMSARSSPPRRRSAAMRKGRAPRRQQAPPRARAKRTGRAAARPHRRAKTDF